MLKSGSSCYEKRTPDMPLLVRAHHGEHFLIQCNLCILGVLCVCLACQPLPRWRLTVVIQGLKVISHNDTLDILMMFFSGILFSSQLPFLLSFPSHAPSPFLSPTGMFRTQTRQGDYLCIECGKGFTQPSHLRTHMRSHTGIFPYVSSGGMKGRP